MLLELPFSTPQFSLVTALTAAEAALYFTPALTRSERNVVGPTVGAHGVSVGPQDDTCPLGCQGGSMGQHIP